MTAPFQVTPLRPTPPGSDTSRAKARVVGRLAPSPTGQLHLGHAFSFLIAWWSARAARGKVVLRLEDVDVGRSSSEFQEQCRSHLAWLGIDWDHERLQSAGIEELEAAAFHLQQRGLAYPCICSRGDIERAREALGAPHLDMEETRYPGTCRGTFASLDEAQKRSGKDAGLRFTTPHQDFSFVDRVFGKWNCNPAHQVGDFLILRRDKTPCYQLAVVVDDARDGVTEVVRGRDLLDSTARQLAIQEALGIASPLHAHLPLVCDHQGRRLAKRHAAVSLEYLKSQGVTATQIVRWVATQAGIASVNDIEHAAQLTERFDWARVPRQDILLAERQLSIFRTR